MLAWVSAGRQSGKATGKRGTYYLASCFTEGAEQWTLYLGERLIKVCESKEEGKELAELAEAEA